MRNSAFGGDAGESAMTETSNAASERHYSIQQIAELWGVSENTVRRSFEDYPGVLKIGIRRHRVTLRIPDSVLRRFHKERSASQWTTEPASSSKRPLLTTQTSGRSCIDSDELWLALELEKLKKRAALRPEVSNA